MKEAVGYQEQLRYKKGWTSASKLPHSSSPSSSRPSPLTLNLSLWRSVPVEPQCSSYSVSALDDAAKLALTATVHHLHRQLEAVNQQLSFVMLVGMQSFLIAMWDSRSVFLGCSDPVLCIHQRKLEGQRSDGVKCVCGSLSDRASWLVCPLQSIQVGFDRVITK